MNAPGFIKAIDGVAKNGDPVSDNLKSIFSALPDETQVLLRGTLLQDYPAQAAELGIVRTTTDKSQPPVHEPAVRPIPAVGDKVTVDGKSGVISEVIDEQATRIKMDDGTELSTETSAITYLYVDGEKAAQDAAWQKEKGGK